MGKKQSADFADTYVMDDDVMEEMESFEMTAVLDQKSGLGSDMPDVDDALLDDIDSSTVVLDVSPTAKRR